MRCALVLGAILVASARTAEAQQPSDAVFDEGTVAAYRITMAAADWNKLVNDPAGAGDLWQRCTVQWQSDAAVADVGIKAVGTNRFPGNPKPAFRLKYDEFVPGREWRGVDDIKLEGSIIEGFNERISYWTHNQGGVPAPRSCHATLIVNGDLKGVYAVVETVRKKFVTYHFGIANPDGNLYKIDRRPNGNTNYSGDHYLWRGGSPSSYVPSIWEAITNEIGGNYSDVVSFVDILNNAPQAERRTRLDGTINLDTFYSYLAVLAATGDYDSILSGDAPSTPNNHFWYHREDTNRLQLVPWDPSNTFGSTYWLTRSEMEAMNIWFGIDPAVTSSTQWDGRSRTNTRATAWIAPDSTARAAYVAKLRSLIDGSFPNSAGRVTFVSNQIRGAVSSDPYRGGPPFNLTMADFDTRVQDARSWVQARINGIRAQLPAPTTPPIGPSGLIATTVSSSQINLAWTDNATNETGFEIDRAAAAGGPWTQIATVGSNVETYSNTGLTASTTYYYRVRATNSAGDSGNSNVANATTLAPPVVVPTAPSGLTATAVSSSQIDLAWTDNSTNETGFEIDRAAAAGGPWTQIATVGSNVETYSNTGLAASTTYYYRVRATNSAGDSANSNVANATTLAPPVVAPTAPSGLTATAISSSQINLAWTDNSANETGFEIDRATAAGGPWTQIATVGANVETYSNTGLTASTTYYYRVRATNSAGDSANSNVASATTQAPSALPTVTIVATDPDAAEPTSTGSFTVSRTGPTTSALSVVRTRTGTATSGADFTALPSPITIPAGQSSVTVTVTPIDDTTAEGDETVILTLTADAAYTVGAASSATVTIADNDAPPTLPTVTIVATDPDAAEPASTGFFTVSRTGSTANALSVVRTRTGTAVSGTDFTALPSPLTIPAGQASVTVTVTPIDDTIVEGDETVILTLPADPAYIVGTASSATVTIADNDSPPPALPTVTITATDPNAAEPSSVGAFTVSRTGPTTNALTVVRTRTGTAVAGTDFAALPSPITIPAGQSSVTVTVTPIDDTTVEGDETVILTLSADPAYTVGTSSSATVTIADNDTAAGGLSATYYDNSDLTGATVTRTDATVDFDWAAGSPAPAIGPDTFSSRWTGRVRAGYDELYTFYSFTNDGVRLWVEGELLVDQWVLQSGGIERSGQIALQAGRWYTIQMEYYENTGNAVARLLWSSPSTPKQVIPANALDPALGPPDSRDNDGDGIPNDTDLDDDNDGIPDLEDADRDGDGVTNLQEIIAGTDPNLASAPPAVTGRSDNPNGDAIFNDKLCGVTGLEALALLALLLIRRRRA